VHWSDDFEEAFVAELEICADYEKRTGRTVWISEWGPTAYSHDSACVESCLGQYCKKFTAACAKFDLAYAIWGFGGTGDHWDIYDEDKQAFGFQYKYLVLDW